LWRHWSSPTAADASADQSRGSTARTRAYAAVSGSGFEYVVMTDAPSDAVHLFGACALPGNHPTTGWAPCQMHVGAASCTCTCRTGFAPHSLLAHGCAHGVEPGQVAANVWRRLPASFKPMERRFGAPGDGAICSVSDFYGLPDEGSVVVDGTVVALHVSSPAPCRRRRAAAVLPPQRRRGHRRARRDFVTL